ncbi:MAG: hypothetical protein ACK53Y_12865, partial [bacterium]
PQATAPSSVASIHRTNRRAPPSFAQDPPLPVSHASRGHVHSPPSRIARTDDRFGSTVSAAAGAD